MNSRIKTIRQAERKYHEEFYSDHVLFEPGSWLHKPVQSVMNSLDHIESGYPPVVLDLGCGVGRNSIPLAQAVKSAGGRVVCVDLLESALDKLLDYSGEHGVLEQVEARRSDIGRFPIEPESYDYIVAVSALEHLESERQLSEVLQRMVLGTKPGGINYIIMNTNSAEFDLEAGVELELSMELNLTTRHARELLTEVYREWQVLFTAVKPLTFAIRRSGREVQLRGDALTFVGKRTCE